MKTTHTVENFLRTHKVPFEIVDHPRSSTSLQTAKKAHIDPRNLAKAVLLQDEQGYIAAVLPADRHVTLDQLCRETGRALRMVPEKNIGEVFQDCEPGAVPALTSVYGVDLVWDECLTGAPEVYFEAGDHRRLVRMTTSDFVRTLGRAPRGRFATLIS